MYQNSFFDTGAGQCFLNSVARNLNRIADAKEEEVRVLKEVVNTEKQKTSGKLSDEAIEKIYRKREHMYRIEDAKFQYYIQYKFGQDDVGEEEACSQLEASLGEDIWEKFVSEFSDIQDCNVADNDTWHMVIGNVLDQISASEK